MLLFLDSIPYIVIFLFGIVIGSFLNVCIYRLPLHESIITAPSHCMTCGRKLRWYDMVPVFSWIVLGGKCRNCKSKISVQYPIIEALNGVLYVLVCAVNGLNWSSLLYCLMTSALLTLSLIDWRTYEIPFGINVFLFFIGIAATVSDRGNLISHLTGAICVSAFLGILFLLSGGRAIGGGDIKLMFGAGFFLGAKLTVVAAFIGILLGGGFGALLLAQKKANRKSQFAFGPFLCIGIAIAMFFGETIADWYMGLL